MYLMQLFNEMLGWSLTVRYSSGIGIGELQRSIQSTTREPPGTVIFYVLHQ